MKSARRKLSIVNVLLALLFLFGLGVLLYPFVCNWFFQNDTNQLTAAYDQAVKDNGADFDKMFAEAREYNSELVGQTVPDVFAIREGTTDPNYESKLNVMGNLMMGYVDIPAINVHLPIYHYSTAESLEKGCGHIFGSSLPVGGESTHAVITAHRGLATAEMFSELDQVKEGDRFFLRVLNKTLAYQVDHIEAVEPQDTRSLAIERGCDYATLVTCTPYGINTQRLLVRGHAVPYTEGDMNLARDVGFRWESLLWMLERIGVAILGAVIAAIVVWLFNGGRPKDIVAAITSRIHHE